MKKYIYDYLIVGSGLFGSVFAQIMNENGKKCLVIDKRNHTGGNIYTKEESTRLVSQLYSVITSFG